MVLFYLSAAAAAALFWPHHDTDTHEFIVHGLTIINYSQKFILLLSATAAAVVVVDAEQFNYINQFNINHSILRFGVGCACQRGAKEVVCLIIFHTSLD
jgi:hypothetical protein